jgi:hypothetical protein
MPLPKEKRRKKVSDYAWIKVHWADLFSETTGMTDKEFREMFTTGYRHWRNNNIEMLHPFLKSAAYELIGENSKRIKGDELEGTTGTVPYCTVQYGTVLLSSLSSLPNNTESIMSGTESTKKESKHEFSTESEPYRFSRWFEKKIISRNLSYKPRTETEIQKWAKGYDLMVRIDGRQKDEVTDICKAIFEEPDNGNKFHWYNNILSPQKLRERWNEGKLEQILRDHTKSSGLDTGGYQRFTKND